MFLSSWSDQVMNFWQEYHKNDVVISMYYIRKHVIFISIPVILTLIIYLDCFLSGFSSIMLLFICLIISLLNSVLVPIERSLPILLLACRRGCCFILEATHIPWGLCPSLSQLCWVEWLFFLPASRENSAFRFVWLGHILPGNLCIVRSVDLGLYVHLQNPFTAVPSLVFDGIIYRYGGTSLEFCLSQDLIFEGVTWFSLWSMIITNMYFKFPKNMWVLAYILVIDL